MTREPRGRLGDGEDRRPTLIGTFTTATDLPIAPATLRTKPRAREHVGMARVVDAAVGRRRATSGDERVREVGAMHRAQLLRPVSEDGGDPESGDAEHLQHFVVARAVHHGRADDGPVEPARLHDLFRGELAAPVRRHRLGGSSPFIGLPRGDGPPAAIDDTSTNRGLPAFCAASTMLRVPSRLAAMKSSSLRAAITPAT